LKAKRDADPLCEFTEFDKLAHGAFPHVFLLGEGVPSKGLSKEEHAHLLKLDCASHQEDPRWSFFAFNVVSCSLKKCT